jgi:transcriptional regulator with XRE-family HTH domain
VEIGDRVRELRRRKALTQEQLAKEVGRNRATISMIEANHNVPHPSTVRRIAEALGVSPEALTDPHWEEPSPKVGPPLSLETWLRERCGHAYLAKSREEFQKLFDQLEDSESEEDERRELGLAINEEYNVFCQFPKNVTTEERVAMRRVIRDAISDVAVKHQLALWESGLFPEYQNELERIFEVERAVIGDEDIA